MSDLHKFNKNDYFQIQKFKTTRINKKSQSKEKKRVQFGEKKKKKSQFMLQLQNPINTLH